MVAIGGHVTVDVLPEAGIYGNSHTMMLEKNNYASDVLGGAATGIFAAALVRSVYREGTRADRFVTSIL